MLETERLTLRRPAPADADAYMEFCLSDRARYTAHTDRQHMAWLFFAAELGHWEMRGWGLFTVVERATGTPVGMVGPYYPEGWNAPEIGWLLWEGAEGKGYAYEAALTSRSFAYDQLGWPTAISNIEPENSRSIRLAEKLGCRLDVDAPKVDAGDLVYRHPSPEVA